MKMLVRFKSEVTYLKRPTIWGSTTGKITIRGWQCLNPLTPTLPLPWG